MSNWSNFGMVSRRAGLSATAGHSCLHWLCASTAYTPVRPGRVQLEYFSSWTSSTSAIYGKFWALRGRTTWQIWRC